MIRREYRESNGKRNRKNTRRWKKHFRHSMLAGVCTMSLLLAACGQSGSVTDSAATEQTENNEDADNAVIKADSSTGTVTASFATVESLESEEMFTKRDLKNTYDEEEMVQIALNGDSAACSDSSVEISGTTVTITKEGTYCLSGTLNDGIVIINTDKSEKVQLVLNGVDISNSSGAAIYVKQADKVFLTTVKGTVNTLSNTGEFEAIDENNIDAVIFSKEDLTLNGEGTLIVRTEYGHGIVSKDDLVIAGGTYEITAQRHGLSGKDSVRIADGDIRIVCGKDGIHSGNDDDDTVGFTYIEGGTITITADDDGIHSDTQLVIAGGTIDIEESHEGLEGQVIEIAGGYITVVSDDDGLNAAGGSSSAGDRMGGFGGMMDEAQEGVYILISGGTLKVNAGGDGLDSNGDLYITGGETYVSGPTYGGDGALDYAGDAQITGGILVAAGYSGMEQNMGSSSTQGSILLNTASLQEAGSLIELQDGAGNVLVSYSPEKTYNSVVVSCPGITVGETYTLHIGNESSEITMTDLIYGSGSGMGGFGGGRGGRGGFGGDGEFGGGRGGFEGDGNFGDAPEFDGEGFGGRPGGRGGFEGDRSFGDAPEFDGEGFGGRPERPGQL